MKVGDALSTKSVSFNIHEVNNLYTKRRHFEFIYALFLSPNLCYYYLTRDTFCGDVEARSDG